LTVRTRRSPALLFAAAGLIAAAAAIVASPTDARAAFDQTWPAFALVAGLLLVGVVAADDGLFESAGAWIGDLPGGGVVLFLASMLLVAGVTVVLNLDTAVVFLTPVLVHAARRRSLDEAAFVYGTVFMCNAASLLLPGSNLTNLIVLADTHVRGASFAAAMAPGWVAAVAVTTLVVWLAHRRRLGLPSARGADPIPRPGPFGALLVALAAVLVVALHDPALPVLAVETVAAAWALVRGRLVVRDVLSAANPAVLVGLLGLAVGLGTLARAWTGPRTLLRTASAWQTAAVAALASIAVNNLPAAVLLGSAPPAHPRALLLGLNVGPNLAVTGSLCAVLWLQVARREGASASPARLSRIGVVLVPLSIAAALAASARVAPHGF
jgi:arsenical pump membrane protein